MDIRIVKQAEKQLVRITKKEQERIAEKIRWLAKQENPLLFSKPIKGFEHTYRFRVGKYRLIFRLENKIIYIVHIDKRDSVYKTF